MLDDLLNPYLDPTHVTEDAADRRPTLADVRPIAPGFVPDPKHPGALRWWDGTKHSEWLFEVHTPSRWEQRIVLGVTALVASAILIGAGDLAYQLLHR
ncbi:DUF2510 domain-containing protein [Nocardioides sp. TRM66260-LWL]|uniref:DUF2510 domain-containing protein n=1 Tax=Nocardioides sp. TRM66260-LWL TaxID=2874478 RepID=UPI001CC42E62|nr:DUF2510 domain-containing protein [Nocardioides sp. TRM66260-LWL]MBZ5734698.1 DUF2510 domain-containing protein [Nocardioides sp. TRM66260-LWL]